MVVNKNERKTKKKEKKFRKTWKVVWASNTFWGFISVKRSDSDKGGGLRWMIRGGDDFSSLSSSLFLILRVRDSKFPSVREIVSR